MHTQPTKIIRRILDILVDPAKGWRVVRDEPIHGRDAILRYVFFVALVPALCHLLGLLIFGADFLFGFVVSFLLFGLSVGSVFLLGTLINSMAPSFGTIRNENAAFKLISYASTPVWVMGLLLLFPDLTLFVALVGFGYATYVFYVGCQVLMETPQEKAAGFSFAAIGIWFGILFVTWLVISHIAALLFSPVLLLK
jgi:hypothetical protein